MMEQEGITGANNVGGFAGYVSGGSVKALEIIGNINGKNTVGGLIGNLATNTIFENNTSSITITASGNDIGGLVGTTASTIQNSKSSGILNANGDNLGGLIGSNTAPVNNSSSSVNVKNTGSTFVGNFVGGLVGKSQSIINSSYATGTVTATNSVGGLAGDAYAPIENSYASGEVRGNSWVGGLVGTSDEVINSYAQGKVIGEKEKIGGLVGQSYGKVLKCRSFGYVSGTKSVGGLVGLANQLVSQSFYTSNVIQTIPQTMPEGGFLDIGGLIGFTFGNISDSFATGNIHVQDQAMYVGGLAGLSNKVDNSYASGSITGGFSLIGGLVGGTYNKISNSIALNPSIKPSAKANLSKVNRFVGGVEADFGGEINNIFALDKMFINDVIPNESDYNATSISLENAQKEVTYKTQLQWDFNDIWAIIEGQGYPYFKDQEYKNQVIYADVNNTDGGNISPRGAISVKEGSNLIFTFTVKYQYEIESIKLDNQNIENTTSYTFSNIIQNHQLIINFKKKNLSTTDSSISNIKIYPNPSSEYVYINNPNGIKAIELYNLTGQKIEETTKNILNISQLAVGQYILKITDQNNLVSIHNI